MGQLKPITSISDKTFQNFTETEIYYINILAVCNLFEGLQFPTSCLCLMYSEGEGLGRHSGWYSDAMGRQWIIL